MPGFIIIYDMRSLIPRTRGEENKYICHLSPGAGTGRDGPPVAG